MRLFELQTTQRKLYHASPTRNREGILKHGLSVGHKSETADMVKHSIKGIFMFALRVQGLNWAFWSAMAYGEKYDVWEVILPSNWPIIPDPHPDMNIYNAYISKESIPKENLKFITTQQIPNAYEPEPRLTKLDGGELHQFLNSE